MNIAWEDARNTWIVRPLIFIGKFFIIVFFIFYVFVGVSATITLVQEELNRQQDVGALVDVIRKSVGENRLNDVTAWVRFRPLAETQTLIGMITPDSGKLGPDMFFELYRRQLQQDRLEDALFWLQLARYRLRYDTLRCGGSGGIDVFDQILNLISSKKIENLLQQHPELVKKSVQQVLDFDAQYPAVNRPDFVCKLANKLKKSNASPGPKEQWERIRLNLRANTEAALKQMDGKPSK
ncbi:MAG: hypothetical protein HY052_04915 [Proteobacteria bacterium]|nr:hypothetical protein [Pseudomonadota bacterium]